MNSGVRITHLPTGLSASSREHRDQPANRKSAFEKLARLLVPIMRAAREEAGSTPSPIRSLDASGTVRTYDLDNHRVKDKRVEGRAWNPEAILDGDEALGEIQHLVLLSGDE